MSAACGTRLETRRPRRVRFRLSPFRVLRVFRGESSGIRAIRVIRGYTPRLGFRSPIHFTADYAPACARLPSLSADASAQASGGQAGSSAGRDHTDLILTAKPAKYAKGSWSL